MCACLGTAAAVHLATWWACCPVEVPSSCHAYCPSSIRLYVRLGTNGCHEIVPDEVYKEAEESAKAALADSDDDEDEDL